jgi:hypothetical protein
MLKNRLAVVMAVALLGSAACDWNPLKPDPVPPSVTQTTNVNVTIAPTPAPAAAATPLPGASGACFVPQVRVGPFGFDCPGRTAPANNAGILPLGCTAVFTATPKDAAGNDLTPAQHGAEIQWSIVAGADHVILHDYGGEPFNKLVQPTSVGDYVITATVCGTTGRYSASVTP